MPSQGSYCDEDGVPDYMQDGATGVDSGHFDDVEENPILIVGSVFQEIMSGVNDNAQPEENGPHFEAEMLGGSYVMKSSSGGVPIKMCSSSDDEIDDGLTRNVNPALVAAFASNKYEREELSRARLHIMELQNLLKKRGIDVNLAQQEKLEKSSDFNKGSGCNPIDVHRLRDDLGLPILKNVIGSKNLPKSILKPVRGAPLSGGVKIDVVPGVGTSGLKDSRGKDILEEGEKVNAVGGASQAKAPEVAKPVNKSWSQVVKIVPKENVIFDYVPRAKGVDIVTPPDEVLKKGNDKFKNCVVGKVTKGSLSFNAMSNFAQKMWANKGLISVYQKDSNVFIIKFNSEMAKMGVLAKGTWYIDRKPLLVTSWGGLVSAATVNSIPLWVKISKIPDSYWTREGLSHLASVVGPPICADSLTSNLDILPFARFCIKHVVGDELPNSVKVVVKDPVTNASCTEEVLFSYPSKPLMCTACKSLGHTVGACPIAIRSWHPTGRILLDPFTEVKEATTVSHSETCQSVPLNDINSERIENNNQDKDVWKVVGTKNGKLKEKNLKAENVLVTPTSEKSIASPQSVDSSPVPVFKNLKQVDEIDMKRAVAEPISPKLSKSQLKKQRKAQGKNPPSQQI